MILQWLLGTWKPADMISPITPCPAPSGYKGTYAKCAIVPMSRPLRKLIQKVNDYVNLTTLYSDTPDDSPEQWQPSTLRYRFGDAGNMAISKMDILVSNQIPRGALRLIYSKERMDLTIWTSKGIYVLLETIRPIQEVVEDYEKVEQPGSMEWLLLEKR